MAEAEDPGLHVREPRLRGVRLVVLRAASEGTDDSPRWDNWVATVEGVEGPVPTSAYVLADIGMGEAVWSDYSSGVMWWSATEVWMARAEGDEDAVFYVWSD